MKKLFLLPIVVLALTGCSTTKTNSELTQALLDYYIANEELLDTICSLNNPDFHDIVMETEAYYNYEAAVEKVDSLIDKQITK